MFLVVLLAIFVHSASADVRCMRGGGTCKYTHESCDGSFRPGLCNGPWNRQCCIPRSGSGDSQCHARGGTCRMLQVGCSGGDFQPGLCAGPSDRQCCIPGSGGGSCSGARIISRAGWGARPPRRVGRMRTPVSMVFVHHTMGSHCTTRARCNIVMRAIQRFHMDNRRWTDIAYNWLVGEDGYVYTGRGWTATGGHTLGYNSRAVAVCIMGNFMNVAPNAAALKAAQDIIACGVSRGYVTRTYELFGHRDGGCTSCPGNQLYSIIQSWPRYSRRRIPRYGCGGKK